MAMLRLGVVMEALLAHPFPAVLDWLRTNAPEITDLEIGSGGYAPHPHCDRDRLLRESSFRTEWHREITTRGLRIGAFNAWGNPLHPDPDISARHDSDLRDTIRLAAALQVDRVVAMAGCPGGAPGDATPHFACGGYLPYLEAVHQQQAPRVLEYWSGIDRFIQRECPGLLICLELHPGTVAYNTESFLALAEAGPSIAANIDPSHFFWMGMDANRIVAKLRARVGHAHAKDVVFNADNLALNGLMDRRWPSPPGKMPWNFAAPGRGRDAAWWRKLAAGLSATSAHTFAIEHEDPFVPAETGIPEAARLLAHSNPETTP
ncbi:MAG TPA: sugar phosphate isomerase/epimerase [Acetobacteraceae bacterium]|nr:sugar phosphate isomerase/epimerase [Acetobacteraceae bacterium]